MNKNFARSTIERIIIKSVLKRPFLKYMDNVIYYTPSKIEKLVLGNMQHVATVTSLRELESALQNEETQAIFIVRDAAVTGKSLKSILDRNGLAKTIYCAFEVQG